MKRLVKIAGNVALYLIGVLLLAFVVPAFLGILGGLQAIVLGLPIAVVGWVGANVGLFAVLVLLGIVVIYLWNK